MLVINQNRIQQLTVNVQLQLLRGGIANPYGTGIFIAFKILEHMLGQVTPAIETINHLKRLARFEIATAFFHPLHKGMRLFHITNSHQGVERE